MTALAALLSGAAVFVLPPRLSAVAAVRLERLICDPEDPARVGARRRPGAAAQLPAPHLPAAIAGGLAVAVVVGGAAGGVAGVVVASVLHRWLSGLEPRSVRLRKARIEADLPVAADLLAACLLAGSSLTEAVEAVADAVAGPLAVHLRRVVATLRLGGDPASSWLAVADEPVLASLGWSLARAADSGGLLAASVARIADEQRLARRWAAEAAARRVGVRAAAPLGLCFLPAFVLIGIVPIVVGIASGVVR